LPIVNKSSVTTREGAKAMAHISLNRLNLDATTYTLDTTWIHNAWPNRPYYIQRTNHIGTTKNISYNITWGQSGSIHTKLSLVAMRGWNGATSNNGTMIFEHVGGGDSKLIDYGILYGGMFNETIAIPNSPLSPPTEQPLTDPLRNVTSWDYNPDNNNGK
jgi:hypothetical protein